MARIPLTEVFVPQQLHLGRPDYDVPTESAAPADSVAVLGRSMRQVGHCCLDR